MQALKIRTAGSGLAGNGSGKATAPPPAPLAGDTVDDVYLSRFRRLTAREVRLMILAVQDGLTPGDLSVALGITRANVANTLQRIRRKLAVPLYEDLASFVRSIPSLAAVSTSHEAAKAACLEGGEQERRRQDLLRVTIDDLSSVAFRARRRAASLERLPVFDDDEAGKRINEANAVRRIAELVEATLDHALNDVRKLMVS